MIHFPGGYRMPNNISKTESPDSLAYTLKKPILHIHFMRIVAAFFVIVNHTVSTVFQTTAPSGTWYLSLAWFFTSKISVPIFIMITGALLLKKKDSSRKWIRRLTRIAVITIVVSALYYIFYHRSDLNTMSIGEFIRLFFKLQISNSLWYLYVYLGLLSMLPIFQDMAASLSRSRIEHLLFISLVIVGGLPLVSLIFQIDINTYITLALITPYIGMLFAGYYIEHYVKIGFKEFVIAAVSFLLLIIFQVAFTKHLYGIDPSNFLLLDERTYITIVAALPVSISWRNTCFQSSGSRNGSRGSSVTSED